MAQGLPGADSAIPSLYSMIAGVQGKAKNRVLC
jgi:hypothetical protein